MRPHYYINGFEVHIHVYKQYLDKELRRMEARCKAFDKTLYMGDVVILDGIKFEVVYL
jgi:hypothetical protein